MNLELIWTKDEKDMKETLVISAFPACGKSWTFEKYKDKYIILDSDSSQFSWIKDEFGNNTNDRNPEFPKNYMNHIKENLGVADIIFVSSHLRVRQALSDNNIPFVTVYPQSFCRLEWVGRCYLRGNDKKFIDFINTNWNSFMSDIKTEPYGERLIRLSHNQWIDDILHLKETGCPSL